jgi:hypothetical protein
LWWRSKSIVARTVVDQYNHIYFIIFYFIYFFLICHYSHITEMRLQIILKREIRQKEDTVNEYMCTRCNLEKKQCLNCKWIELRLIKRIWFGQDHFVRGMNNRTVSDVYIKYKRKKIRTFVRVWVVNRM